MRLKSVSLLLLLAIVAFSCNKDEEPTPNPIEKFGGSYSGEFNTFACNAAQDTTFSVDPAMAEITVLNDSMASIEIKALTSTIMTFDGVLDGDNTLRVDKFFGNVDTLWGQVNYGDSLRIELTNGCSAFGAEVKVAEFIEK